MTTRPTNQHLKLLLLDCGQIGDDVGAALNLLCDALGDEEEQIRGEDTQAMQSGDYDTANVYESYSERNAGTYA